MTFKTSAVAVCCCSDLKIAVRACTSSNSRAFSIAITAWSAKVRTSSICARGKWAWLGSPQNHHAFYPVIPQEEARQNRTHLNRRFEASE